MPIEETTPPKCPHCATIQRPDVIPKHEVKVYECADCNGLFIMPIIHVSWSTAKFSFNPDPD